MLLALNRTFINENHLNIEEINFKNVKKNIQIEKYRISIKTTDKFDIFSQSK
jgi:hypothetical protein